MKNKNAVIVIIALAALACISGCEKDDLKLEAEQKVEQYLATESKDDFLDKMKQASSLESVSDVNDEYTVTLDVPDLNKMADIAKNDVTGFCVEYQTLKLKGSTDKEEKQYVQQYFSKILGTTDCGTVQIVMKVGEELDSSDFEKYVQTFDYVGVFESVGSALDNSNEIKDAKVVDTLVATMTKAKTTDTFTFTKDGNTFEVTNVKIKKGSDAITEVNKLSTANDFRMESGVCYFITYDVINLSSKKYVINNGFVLANADKVVKLKSNITGLRIVNEIDDGGKKQFTCFLAGPEDSKLYWLSTQNGKGTNGSYIFEVVL